MRRPILGVKKETETRLNTSVQHQATIELKGLELEKRLRKKRSDAYTEAVTQLDAGGVVCRTDKVQELLQMIANEFPELKPHQFPNGIISKCYLGSPYEVHTLNAALAIIEHYKAGHALPSELEKGRALALHPGYAYIEVFSDSICAVTHSGNVSMIKG
ncbi:hypothetical protein [Paenibacillus sp. GCM10027626]|uniref:hypothetical protein n=1 Tax=Paenibacillus sp. GCM10027626 TaxID=3273411 RepID=UPI003645D990